MSFVNTHSEHFVLSTHDVTDKACQYARGLMQAGSRKNMDRMAEVVPDAKSRNLQQFLAHSTWDERAVIDKIHAPYIPEKKTKTGRPIKKYRTDHAPKGVVRL